MRRRCGWIPAALGICLALGGTLGCRPGPDFQRSTEELRVDYRKTDAALAIALTEDRAPDERSLEVFVHLARRPNEDEAPLLRRLGLTLPERGSVVTARLSPRDVAELSQQPWVQQIKLAQRLRPTGE